MKIEHTALIIIDLQNGIKAIAKKAQPHTFEEVMEANRKLIDYFGHQNAPIYLVSVQLPRFPKFINKSFGKLLLEEKAKQYSNVHILIKQGPSAFTQSEYGLEEELKKFGVTKIMITGVSTSNGVIKTAKDGFAAGFKVAVIEDACSDRNKEDHDRVVQQEIPKIGNIIQTESVLPQ